jgi:arabinose-5-phosphate isomerase
LFRWTLNWLRPKNFVKPTDPTMRDTVLETARRTLAIEVQALQALENSFNDHFVAAVEEIYKSNGRVIFTGIGKSAIVAQKIVATFNSTGTPAVFMHAADAIHGDLGIIQSDDCVICISKSGDTPEIKVLAPMLKKFGSHLIAMVSNTQSYLAQNADYVLHIPIEQEADPNNLAPTASTTAQMVMGDALATSLLALKGFTAQDFAQFHPGGALGKQLYLTVNDILAQHEKPSVKPSETLKNVIIEMTSKRLGATAVIDAQNRLLGIITDGDLRRMLGKTEWQELAKMEAQNIMTPQAVATSPDTLAVETLALMRRLSISQVAVVDAQNTYIGLVHLHDFIKEGIV